MDPIDFTKPETFGQAGASSVGGLDGAAESVAQNPEAMQRLRRALWSLLRWSVYTLLAWSAGAALLVLALQRAQQGASALEWPPDWSVLLARMQELYVPAQMLELAWMTLDLVYIPVLLFALFVWIPHPLSAVRKRLNGTGSAALGELEIPLLVLIALKFAAIAFAVIAAGYVARAAWAIGEGDNPLEILPGITPPYLREFLARHPALAPHSTIDSNGDITLRDGKGHSMRLHRAELDSAQARFEPCPVPLGAEQLGGIPPYPGARCATLLRLRRVEDERVFHVFEIADRSDSAAIKTHFKGWADAHGLGGASSNKKGSGYAFSTSSRDAAWHLDVDSSAGGATTIVIRHTSSPMR